MDDWRVKLHPWIAQEHITPSEWCNQEIPHKRGLLNGELYLLRFLCDLRADAGGETINIQLNGAQSALQNAHQLWRNQVL